MTGSEKGNDPADGRAGQRQGTLPVSQSLGHLVSKAPAIFGPSAPPYLGMWETGLEPGVTL